MDTITFRERYNKTMQAYVDLFNEPTPTFESPVSDTLSPEYVEMIEDAIKSGEPIHVGDDGKIY